MFDELGRGRVVDEGTVSSTGVWAVLHEPAVNTDAVATKAAVGGVTHQIYGLSFTYSGTPTAGQEWQLLDGATVVLSGRVTAYGPYHYTFPVPIAMTEGNLASAVLLAGGAGISAKANLVGRSV